MAFKIKQLFDEITKQKVYPLTTTKAVKDTTTKKSLFELLSMTPMMEDGGEVSDTEVRDADTLGGISAGEFAKKSDYNGIICVLVKDNWVQQEDESYVYTVICPSLTGNEFFDVNLYDDGTATQEQIDTFNELVTRIDVNAGEILIRAWEKPEVTFSIILRGMCNIDDVVVANLTDVIEKYEELQSELNSINDGLTSMFMVVSKSSESITVKSNTYATCQISNVAPTGYKILGVVGHFLSGGRTHIYGATVLNDSNQITISLWNNSATDVNTSVSIDVLLQKVI